MHVFMFTVLQMQVQALAEQENIDYSAAKVVMTILFFKISHHAF